MVCEVRIPAHVRRRHDPRPNRKNAPLLRRIAALHNVPVLGPRSNDRHISSQHVPELRQFVDAELAQQLANRRDSLVRLLRDPAIRRITADTHGAQLDHVEELPVQPGPLRSVKGWSARREPYGCGSSND